MRHGLFLELIAAHLNTFVVPCCSLGVTIEGQMGEAWIILGLIAAHLNTCVVLLFPRRYYLRLNRGMNVSGTSDLGGGRWTRLFTGDHSNQDLP